MQICSVSTSLIQTDKMGNRSKYKKEQIFAWFNSIFNDTMIGRGGAASGVLFSWSRRDWDGDQDLHRHDRGHGPVHLCPPGQRAKRDHQNEPLHRGWRTYHGLWCSCLWHLWDEPYEPRGGANYLQIKKSVSPLKPLGGAVGLPRRL